MHRFIKFCAAFILLSFMVVPIYYGITNKHDNMAQEQKLANVTQTLNDEEITLQKIYDLANLEAQTPEVLNNLETAAGGSNEFEQVDQFSTGFNQYNDNTL